MNELITQQRVMATAKSWAQDYIRAAQFDVASEYELARLVEMSAIIFACVQFRARNVSRVKYIAYDGDDRLDEWHPAQRTVSDLRQWGLRTETAHCVYGDSLSQILINKYHMPLKLKFINNHLWGVNTWSGRHGGAGHDYTVNITSNNYDTEDLTKRTLEPNEVVFLINALDMFSDYEGLSPLEAAYLSGATGVEMSQTQLYTFVNRAIPALIIQPEVEQPRQLQTINGETAANSLATLLRQLFKGAKNVGKALVQPYRWQVLNLQTDFDKLGMSELRSDEVNQVITAFELRQSLILSNAANYATARQDAVGWADDWLLPRTQRIGETIAQQLQPYCPDVPNLRIVPDEASLPYLEDKKLAQIEADTNKAKSAIIDLATLQERSGETPNADFVDLYWYEGIGWLPKQHFKNAWTYQYTTAPSALNTGALPDDIIPFDAGVTEQTLEEQQQQIEELQAQTDLQEAESQAVVAEAEADAIEEESKLPQKAVTWSDDDIARSQSELKQWSKFTQSKGAKAVDTFTFEYVPENVVQRVKARLAGEPDTPYGDIFSEARNWIQDASKSIQSTRLNFENDLEDLIASARAGGIDKRRFGVALRNLIKTSGTSAYTDGLIAGGVTDGALDDDDRATINRMSADQSGYVTDFGNVLYGDGITDAEANQKPIQWWNKSVNPFYLAGIRSADRNGMYEWVLGSTEEHCDSCRSANGQIHRMRDWERSGVLPQSSRLQCGGWECKCNLVKTSARARGRLTSIKAHDHAHDELPV